MSTISSLPTTGQRFQGNAWLLCHAPDCLYHIPHHHNCTHAAVPGGQAPGEIIATSYKLLAHNDAANLAWCVEVPTH